METFYVVSPIEKMDVRDSTANHDNTWTMSGYAAVFGHTATLFDSEFQKVTVTIDPKAFANVLKEQGLTTREGAVRFNYGHQTDTSVAATDVPAGQPGSLELGVDKNGLHFLARVSRDDPDAVRLAAKMRTGVVKQASFAFTSSSKLEIEEDDTGKEQVARTITEVTHLYDVCAAVEGVFTQTVSGLQNYARSLGQPTTFRFPPEVTGGRQRQPGLGGANPVSPDRGGEADITPPWSVDLSALMARADRLKPVVVTEGNRDVRAGHPDDSHV